MPCRFFSCLLLLCLASNLHADNWPSWRGPFGDGSAVNSGYPTEWSLDKNIAWHLEMPGKSGSTPLVWEQHIILTSVVDGKNVVTCLNRNGEKQWEKTLGEARPGKHKKASGANPSPITDGQQVFVYFKSGDLAALDFEGNVKWQHNLQDKYGEDTLWWDLGTSPVLTDKHVVVTCMQSPPSPSYLAAFDKESGEQAWFVERELGAPKEAAQSYSTPIVTKYEGEEQIIVLGADYVTCHKAANGEEIWRVGTLNPKQEQYWRSIASPALTENIVLAPYARGDTLTAIKMGGKGDVTKSHVLWTKEGLSSDVPTPAATHGSTVVLTDRGTVAMLNAETGDVIWSTDMEKNRNKFSTSPVWAGNIYVVREDAKTFVLNDKTGEVISSNSLGDDEFAVATPVFVDGMILLRTIDHLYCIKN